MNAIKCAVVGLIGMMAWAARAEEPAWRPLFNGRDLDGWVVRCKPADSKYPFWKVEDGTILADSMDAGKHDYVWLATREEYGDFTLKLKFQAYRGNPGNSGVQVRSRYDEQAFWMDGPQVDINPPGAWRTGMMWDETRGVQRWIFPDLPKGKWVNESMAPRGLKLLFSDQEPAWNDLEIAATGLKVKALLNGVVVTDYNGAGLLDDETHARRNVGRKGVIALQIHTGDRLKIRFKDIAIRVAP